MSTDKPEVAPEASAGQPIEDTRSALPPQPLRVLSAIGAAGVISGLMAFAIGEAIYEMIPAELVDINTMGRMVRASTAATVAVADAQNGALAYGVLGACLGGCFGIAGGLARRAPRAAIVAALLGSIVGLAVCAAVSRPALPVFMRAQTTYFDYEMLIVISMHGLLWGLAGATAGLALAAGLGRPRLFVRALAAGFVGAVLGAIAFDLVAAMLFPFAETGAPVSTSWPSRLLARVLVCLATAGMLALAPND